MLFGLFITLFVIVCFLLILMILVQQGKGGMGLGSLGGGTQMLFGGSGGQDIFQKITWVLGALFIAGSLVLALAKSKGYGSTKHFGKASTTQKIPVRTNVPAPTGQTKLPAQ